MSSSISTWDIPNIIPPCPQVDGKRKAPRSVPVKVLLPHEVMHALAHSSEFAFNTLILGNTDSETRSAFWEHVSKQKPWSNQPCIHAAHASCTLDKLVGCSIHGDGTQMYREDEFSQVLSIWAMVPFPPALNFHHAMYLEVIISICRFFGLWFHSHHSQ